MSTSFPKWVNDNIIKFNAIFLTAFITDFADYPQKLLGKTSYAVLLALDLNANAKDIKEFDALLQQTSQLGGRFVRISDDANIQYISAEVTLEELETLANLACISELQFCDPPVPNRNMVRVSRAASKGGEIPKSKNKSIVAIIDHGCPFAHQGFQNPSNPKSSRFLTIWDQDAQPDFPIAAGVQPILFGYGRQVNRDAIEGFIQQATSLSGDVNEDLCYQLAEYDAVDSPYVHGSYTLGLLASHLRSPSLSVDTLPFKDKASQADIVFVQLPRHISLAPDVASIERFSLDGLRYILECAGDDTTDIVVVIDYGSDIGPHDGSELFVRAVDALVDEALKMKKALSVVFPTGNSFDKAQRAQATFLSSRLNKLYWSLPLGNEMPSVADIWLSDTATPCELTISPPGKPSQKVSLNAPSCQTFGFYAVTVKIFFDQRQVLIQTAPTGMPDAPNRPIAPSGAWQFGFDVKVNAVVKQSLVDSFNIIAYTLYGGRNAGFPQRVVATKFLGQPDQNNVCNGDFVVAGCGSILSSACGAKSYAIGGYVGREPFSRSKYSGAGNSRGGHYLTGVLYVAVTDEGYALKGLLCMGSRSGGIARIYGTSLAAPQAARELLEMSALAAPVISDPSRIVPAFPAASEFGEGRLHY